MQFGHLKTLMNLYYGKNTVRKMEIFNLNDFGIFKFVILILCYKLMSSDIKGNSNQK